jgi:5-formyltetrahydrofolate cyclo-ligase
MVLSKVKLEVLFSQRLEANSDKKRSNVLMKYCPLYLEFFLQSLIRLSRQLDHKFITPEKKKVNINVWTLSFTNGSLTARSTQWNGEVF